MLSVLGCSCRQRARLMTAAMPMPLRRWTSGAPPLDLVEGSPEARRALKLFLADASPAAASTVGSFLRTTSPEEAGTTTPPTLDDFLLDALHKGADGDASGPFELEWIAFATGAKKKYHTKSSSDAWAQFEAFGGVDGAPALRPPPMSGRAAVADEVSAEGVALISDALRPSSAAALREFVLAERDARVELAAVDPTLHAEFFSRVLSPRNAAVAGPTTRWDVRLPWHPSVSSAVFEILDDDGTIGEAMHKLCGGDDAVLWECSAFVSAEGSAPQIVHADTIFTPKAEVLTLFVALQNVARHQGPTRFVPRTHHGRAGEEAHHALADDAGEANASVGSAYCAGASSVVALLSAGDAALYDSRLHHSGGPHLPDPDLAAAAAQDPSSPPEERVIFAISFRHAAAEASSVNADKHGLGSILPELAERRLKLGELRASVVA